MSEYIGWVNLRAAEGRRFGTSVLMIPCTTALLVFGYPPSTHMHSG